METTTQILTTISETFIFNQTEIVQILKNAQKLPTAIENVIVEFDSNSKKLFVYCEKKLEQEKRYSQEQIELLTTPIADLVYSHTIGVISNKAAKALKSAHILTLLEFKECDKAKLSTHPKMTKKVMAELIELFSEHQITM